MGWRCRYTCPCKGPLRSRSRRHPSIVSNFCSLCLSPIRIIHLLTQSKELDSFAHPRGHASSGSLPKTRERRREMAMMSSRSASSLLRRRFVSVVEEQEIQPAARDWNSPDYCRREDQPHWSKNPVAWLTRLTWMDWVRLFAQAVTEPSKLASSMVSIIPVSHVYRLQVR